MSIWISLGILLVKVLLHIVAMAIPQWGSLQLHSEFYEFGLWRSCNSLGCIILLEAGLDGRKGFISYIPGKQDGKKYRGGIIIP